MTHVCGAVVGVLANMAGTAQSIFSLKILPVSCTVTVHTNGGGAQGGTTTTLRGMVLRTYVSLAQVELASIVSAAVDKELSAMEEGNTPL